MAAAIKAPSNPNTVLIEALCSIQDYGDLSKNTNSRNALMVQLTSENCAEIARSALIQFEAANKGLKTYALICKTFGRKFSFHARSQEDAEAKARGWCAYHSFSFADFSVEEVEPGIALLDLHNEYVKDR